MESMKTAKLLLKNAKSLDCALLEGLIQAVFGIGMLILETLALGCLNLILY